MSNAMVASSISSLSALTASAAWPTRTVSALRSAQVPDVPKRGDADCSPSLASSPSGDPVPKLAKPFIKPSLALLPRVADQLGFLYVDIARIAKDDNGVAAFVTSPERGTERVYLPTASIAAIMLGPGTSITQPAARQILRDGSSIVLCGTMLSRCYGAMTHDDLTTRWLHAQAEAWADPEQRAEVPGASTCVASTIRNWQKAARSPSCEAWRDTASRPPTDSTHNGTVSNFGGRTRQGTTSRATPSIKH